MPITNLASKINNCLLSLSSTNLLLSPGSGGGQINISGSFYSVPASGPTLAPTGLTASTLYYIYAALSSGAIILEASTTGYIQNASFGNLSVKSSDSTRTLVGMARTTAGTLWVDNNVQRFVRSYYNDAGLQGSNTFSTARSTSSASAVEVNSEIRAEALFWNDDILNVSITGEWSNVTATNNCLTSIGLDGTTTILGQSHMIQPAANGNNGMPLAVSGTAIIANNGGIGYHYVTLVGTSANASALSWNANDRINYSVTPRRGY